LHAIPGTIRRVDNLIHAVAFSPDGSLLAFGESGADTMATIRIFDTKTWKLVGEIAMGGDRFSGSPITVFDLAISRDRLLTAATHANGIRVWRL
jgi:WD40 repeat protein